MSDQPDLEKREVIPSDPPEGKAEKGIFDTDLLIAIFSQIKKIEGKTVTPLNVEKEMAEVRNRAQREYKFDKEIYDGLLTLSQQINGGITAEVYEQYKRVINRMAREKAEIGGGHSWYDQDNEDRLAQEPMPEYMARYPEDKIYEGASYNIFDHKRGIKDYPSDEGNLYLRIYDDDEKLRVVRIFAQVHRDTLVVKKVDVEDIYKAIDEHVAAGEPQLPEISVAVIDKETFLSQVQEFNARYGNVVAVDIDEFDRIKLLFKQNIRALIEKFNQLEPASGFRVDSLGGFIEDGKYSGNLEFVHPEKDRATIHEFDPEKHQHTQTKLSLNDHNVEKFAPLIKLYVEQELASSA